MVAVCIPVYEKIELLQRLLGSILKQTYDKYIIIITDNSETDIIEEYMQTYHDRRIIYYHNEYNLGASENTNQSIRYAIKYNADVIKIIYQDDWFTYEYSLERMVQRLMETESDIIFTGNIESFPNHKKERICSESQINRVKNDLTFIFRANILGAPSNILFKSSEIFFDSAYTWLLDVDFYLRVLRNKKLEYIYEPLVTIGHDGDQLTDYYMMHPEIMLKETLSLYKKHKVLHTNKNIRYLFHFIWICIKISIKKVVKAL